MNHRIFVQALLLAAVLLPPDAAADSYRCGRQVVRDGDTVSRRLEVCGPPLRKSSGAETFEVAGVPRRARVTRWHYRMGARRLERQVLVYQGRIVAIELAGR